MNRQVTKLKWLFAVIIVAAVVIASFYARRYLSLESIKNARQNLSGLYENHAFSFVAVYMFIYILTTGLGIPGAAVLTLLAGAFFGFGIGTVTVSFASTLGATGAFLVARFLLRDWVNLRFGSKLERIQSGLDREGAFYLFTLRLIPIFPFFVINAVMGLTRMKTWTFYWVSQVGMLAGTMVYVNAGKQLWQIDSLKGILSWEIILSFALLGLFPLFTKKIVGYIKRKRNNLHKVGI